MISLREVALALFGVWRLAHLDKNGLQYLDDSIAGFWNSFYAAIIVLPGFVILQLLELAFRQEAVVVESWPRVLAVWSIAYVLQWTLFPIATAYITAEIDRRDEYLRFIVALNWASVIQVTVAVPAVTLQVVMGPNSAGVFFFILISLALLFYSWFISKTALNVSGAVAAGLVVLNLVLSQAINVVGDGLTGL